MPCNAPDSGRRNTERSVRAEAGDLYHKSRAGKATLEHLQMTGYSLIDRAIDCWLQVRPLPHPVRRNPGHCEGRDDKAETFAGMANRFASLGYPRHGTGGRFNLKPL
jgi:hypothetical protein